MLESRPRPLRECFGQEFGKVPQIMPIRKSDRGFYVRKILARSEEQGSGT